MASKPETVFRARVMKFLKTIPNSLFFSIQSIAIRGIPDIIGLINGRFIALELKTDEGKPTALQSLTLSAIDKAGGVAILLYPAVFELTKEILLNLQKEGIKNGSKKESSEKTRTKRSESSTSNN